MVVEHTLSTTLVGDAIVVVPDSWPPNAGFMLVVRPFPPCPLVRIHSRCAYGDVFGSRHCDCQEQLRTSAQLIRAEGGVIVYLEQEGRGAGIAVKAKAYRAAEHDGIDTFTHYESAGITADPRQYAHVPQALLDFGLTEIRLLTNNLTKVNALSDAGISVERVSLVVDADPLATPYLAAKRERGHLL
jgi:3,4-dihydroxy 2-butanone 4-phosphate synthase/GTP cyclohydrolase II